MTKIKTYSNKEYKIINKLFLIGNGFDLALGLKTSYKSFLLWYLKDFFLKSLEKAKYIKRDNKDIYFYHEDKLCTIYNTENYSFSDFYLKIIDDISKLDEFLNKLSEDNFVITFKSKILKDSINDSSNTWIDLEGTYYDILKALLQNKNKDYILKLNSDLTVISELLKEYLSNVDYSISNNRDAIIAYIKQFIQEIKKEDIIEPIKEKKIKSEKYYFLNFNYTKTISNTLKYFNFEFSSKYGYNLEPQISHIHGDLNANEIIFGYGDEIDQHYKKIEELNDNRFFENIKSFKYAKYPEYRNLLRFLNSGDYQVIIYGHSCGLSDRLLLNEVFEHEKCKSIKIFYYEKEEFIQKTMNISRHFKSNQLMRQKIVEFDESNKIPQLE